MVGVDATFLITGNATPASARLNTLRAALPAAHEIWPAVRGVPSLLKTHATHLRRGVEAHLYRKECRDPQNPESPVPLPSCAPADIQGWGTVGNFLSHVTLLEHVAAR